jgi:copper transport protein
MLEFTEEVEPRSTLLQLLDSTGMIVSSGPVLIDPAEAKTVRMALPQLEDGAYGLHWSVQSQVDGHITKGSVNFAIGSATTEVSILPPPGSVALTWQWPAVIDVIQRWLSFIGMALAFGTIVFMLGIWQPLIGLSRETTVTASWLRRRMVRLVWLGSGLMLAGSLFYLFLQANRAARANAVPLSEALAQSTMSHIGMVIMARLTLIVALVFVVGRLESERRSNGIGWRGWIAFGLSAVVLLTYSMQSHAAALATSALAVDYLHLLAMAAWLGGLLVLLSLLLWREAEAALPWGMLVQRFSNVALVSVLLLSATGLALAYLHVRTLEALSQTAYGWLLMGKSLLFLFMLAAAAINLLLLVPRLRRGAQAAANILRNTVRFELAVGLMLLVVVGALTATAPAFETLQAQQRQGLFFHTLQDQVDLTVRIAPGIPGDNEFAVDLIDSREQAAAVPAQVLLRFTHQEHDMGVQEIELFAVDAIRYATRGSYLTMSGPLQGEVIVRRAGFNDVRSQFEYVMPASGP